MAFIGAYVLIWQNSLGRFRKYGLFGGSKSLETRSEVSKA